MRADILILFLMRTNIQSFTSNYDFTFSSHLPFKGLKNLLLFLVFWCCIFYHEGFWVLSYAYVDCCSSVAKFCPPLCDPVDCKHARLPCPSPNPWVFSDSCPLSQWYYLTISSTAASFSFCLQFFPASRSFPMSRLFTSGGQSIGAAASASVLPLNIQDWFPFFLFIL